MLDPELLLVLDPLLDEDSSWPPEDDPPPVDELPPVDEPLPVEFEPDPLEPPPKDDSHATPLLLPSNRFGSDGFASSVA